MNIVHNIDFLNNDLPDKCANLIIADPPYYKVKGDFDFIWKTFDDYLEDVEKWAVECKRILSDNGTLLWYGDSKKIAYAQIIFDKYLLRETAVIVLSLFGIATVVTLLSIFPFDFSVITNPNIAEVLSIVITIALIGITIGLGIATLVRFIKLIVNVLMKKTGY